MNKGSNNPSQPKKKKAKSKQKQPSASRSAAKRVAKNLVRGELEKAEIAMDDFTRMRIEQAESIVLSMTAPKEYPPVRTSTVFTAGPTAVAKLYQVQNASFADYVTTGSPNNSAAFVFRDPYRAFITLVQVNAGFTYSYSTTTFSVSNAVSKVQIPGLSWVGGSGAQPHGPILYPGQVDDDTRQYFYAGYNKTFTLANNIGTALSVYTYRYWQGIITPGPTFNVANGTSATYTTTLQNGYYGFDVYGAAVATGTFSFSLSAPVVASPAIYEWGHFALPDLTSVADSVDAIKIYGAALMYTNTAAPINRQGKIAGCQIPQGREWFDYVDYSIVSTLESACVKSAENGIYGFLKPMQAGDYDFRDRNKLNSAGIQDSWFKLNPDSDFLAIALNVNTTAGQDGQYLASFAIEFETQKQWFEKEVPSINARATEFAVGMVGKMPQWHENPLHLSDITNWLKDTASSVYNYVKETLPDIVSGATKVATIAGAVLPLL